MKLIANIKQSQFLRNTNITTNQSCSIVGNSGMLLKKEYGEKIDSNQDVIRFNNAVLKGYEKHTGHKTTYRIMNCHHILNIDDNRYYLHQKTRFPTMDRFFAYKLRNEKIIFKTDPSWRLWEKKNIIKKIEENNSVYFIDEEFYNLGKKINHGKEPTNGFVGLMFGLKHYQEIHCFGFSFYEKEHANHYYDQITGKELHDNHNLDMEKKWFSLLEKSNVITINR